MNINYYNPYVRRELELYHHGIAGQKWGKKNGPPYPLAASAHSAAEKKAGWKGSIYKGKSTHFSRKVEKYIAKKGDGKNTRRAQKALNLIERQKAKDTYELRKAKAKGDNVKAAQHQMRIGAGERKAKELIKNYADKGYTISSAKVIRDAAYGKHVFTNYYNPLITAAHTIYRKGSNYVEGNRYKVSKNDNPRYLKKENQGKNYERSSNTKQVLKVIDTVGFHKPGGWRTTNYRKVNQFNSNSVKQDRSKVGKSFQNKSSDLTSKLRSLSYEKRQQIKNNIVTMPKSNFTSAKAMRSAGKSYADIAKNLGVSESTVWAMLNNEDF